MYGHEHYTQAEQFDADAQALIELAASERGADSTALLNGARALIARGQLHATLALAAAQQSMAVVESLAKQPLPGYKDDLTNQLLYYR